MLDLDCVSSGDMLRALQLRSTPVAIKDIHDRFARIEHFLKPLGDIVQQLDNLKAAVLANTAAAQLAIAALQTAATNAIDPAELQAAADQLKASSDALNAAVTPVAATTP